jgi:hypothetical protein
MPEGKYLIAVFMRSGCDNRLTLLHEETYGENEAEAFDKARRLLHELMADRALIATDLLINVSPARKTRKRK